MPAHDDNIDDRNLDQDLLALYAALDRAKIPVGIVERQRANTLVARLLVDGAIKDFAELRPHLTPLLARNRRDQDEIAAIFERLAPGPDQPDPMPPAPPHPPSKQPLGWWPWLKVQARPLLALSLLLALVLTAVVIERMIPETEPLDPIDPADIAAPEGPRTTGTALGDPAPEDPDEKSTAQRVIDTAANYDFAPTLQELAEGLNRDNKIGWTDEAYAQGLSELSGFVGGRPLDVTNLLDEVDKVDNLYFLALAVERLERPGPSITVPEQQLWEAKDSGFAKGLDAAIALATAIRDDPQSDVDDEDSFTSATAIDPAALIEGFSLSSPAVGAEQIAQTGDGSVPLERQAISITPSFAARQFALVHPQLTHKLMLRPWVREHWSFWPWLATVGGLALATLALFVLWWTHRKELRRAYLRRRMPKFSPIYTDLIADSVTDHLRSDASDRRVMQALQARSDSLTRRIDLEASIKATISSGSHEPKFIMRRLRPTPEYLVLIQRESAQDQGALRLLALLKRLRKAVHFDIFFYQTVPDRLTPEEGGQAQPVETLAARFPQHRLLVLGDGADFIDPITGFLRPGAEALLSWGKRALLTPKPLRSWGPNEFTIARKLAMPIGRATTEGLAVLGEVMTGDDPSAAKLDPSGELIATALPASLQANQRRMIYPEPPLDYPADQVVRDLQVALHPATFDWLSALAVYPTLQWDLTLYLGLTLTERSGGGSGHVLFNEGRAGMLTELPWLRHGVMPDWLRRTLIENMDETRHEEIGGLLRDLLQQASEADRADDTKVGFRLGKEPNKDPLLPEQLFDDSVFMEFLDEAKIEDFELPDRGIFKTLAPLAWKSGWTHVDLFAIIFAALYTGIFVALGFFSGLPPVTGSWRPLVMAGLGLAVLTGLGWPHLIRGLAYGLAPYLTALAAVLAVLSLVPLSMIQVSGGIQVGHVLVLLLSVVALFIILRWLRRWSLLTNLSEGRYGAWLTFALGSGVIALLAIWLDAWLRHDGGGWFASITMLALSIGLTLLAWASDRQVVPVALSDWWFSRPWRLKAAGAGWIMLGGLPALVAWALFVLTILSTSTPDELSSPSRQALEASLGGDSIAHVIDAAGANQILIIEDGFRDERIEIETIAGIPLSVAPITAMVGVSDGRLAIGRLDGTGVLMTIVDGAVSEKVFEEGLDGRVRFARPADDHIHLIGDDGATLPVPMAASDAAIERSDPDANLALGPLVPWDKVQTVVRYQPGEIFRDCDDCPELVVIPAGTILMGSPEDEVGRSPDESPQYEVTISASFALGTHEVTFAEWDACVAAGSCGHVPEDEGWGRGDRPVINVSFEDAQIYIAWLSTVTGEIYRLPSEAEWEYAARAGTTTRYFWGDEIGENLANCDGCGSEWDNRQTAPVGSFAANDPFGLYDMHGNVWEWLEDSWHENYEGAPPDGSAWVEGKGSARVLRGGSWNNFPDFLRSANRDRDNPDNRLNSVGFRVSRTLTP